VKWDRDQKGRFAATDISGGVRKPIKVPETEPSLAASITALYRPARLGKKRVDRWWIGGSNEGAGTATVHERYGRGRLGKPQPHPSGGTQRPLLEPAGWKFKGAQPHTPERQAAWRASQAAAKTRISRNRSR